MRRETRVKLQKFVEFADQIQQTDQQPNIGHTAKFVKVKVQAVKKISIWLSGGHGARKSGEPEA